MTIKPFLPCLIITFSMAALFTSCSSDDDNENRPPSSNAGKDHIYQFTVNGSDSYAGTVPNLDMVSLHTASAEGTVLNTAFNTEEVSFNCIFGFKNDVVLPLADLGGSVGEGSTMIISLNNGEVGYFSVSGSVVMSNLSLQNTVGNMSWATYTVQFDGSFADAIDETANIVQITGSYTLYPEAD